MNKVAIIIVYIGDFPNYFDLWELSASYNNQIDFHIYCNKPRNQKYNNVYYHNISLEEFKRRVEDILQMKVELSKPYKLCEYRPMYGVVFEEDLKNYLYWGYCDLDLIFGKIDTFLTDDILNSYDKIYRLGHFTIFKNTAKMNNLFKIDNNSTLYNYKTAFTTAIACHFDEKGGISTIAENERDIKCYNSIDFADIVCDIFRFKLCRNVNSNRQIYLWENGKLYCCYLKDNKLIKEEKMYAHLQKREMAFANDFKIIDNKFLIVPNQFINYENVDSELVFKYSKNKPYWSWWFKLAKLKIKKFNKETIKQKLFRMKRKRYLEKTYKKEINVD